MGLRTQTLSLFQAARQLAASLPADAVLLMPEADLDWEQVRAQLGDTPILVAPQDAALRDKIKEQPGLAVLEIDAGPTPIQERMSLALLEAIRAEKLRHGADVVVLYNGINIGADGKEQIDSVSVIHLGEHLERLTVRQLRQLDTQVPLEILRAVVDLAVEIGQEGREGKPVGTMLVVGDYRRVRRLSRPMNFNPFRGYSKGERDVRKTSVREQIKDIAQLEGAILIDRNGIVQDACMHIQADNREVTLSKGLGTRHAAAAAVSRATKAIAVAVSQSSGTVRIFQNGQIALTVEPLARPVIWGKFQLGTQDTNGSPAPSPPPPKVPKEPKEPKERARSKAVPEQV